MVTRLRTVSNRICCDHYMKTASGIRVENNAFNFRKPIRNVTFAEQNTVFVPTVADKSFTASSAMMYSHENTLHPRNTIVDYSNNVPRDTFIFLNANNIVNSSSVSEADYNADRISLPGTNRNKSHLDPPSDGRPSAEQLENVFRYLSEALPKLFQIPFKADVLHDKVVLENNIRKTKHIGLMSYMTQLALLRMVAHLKFAYVRFHVLKITKHPETGTIKCRWRIAGISGTAVIFQFWKFPLLKMREKMEQAPTWYDGFSTYYVGPDGLIHKHVIDKMMPDDDQVTIDKTIAPKVALFLGLLPKSKQEAFINFTKNYKNSKPSSPATSPSTEKLHPLMYEA